MSRSLEGLYRSLEPLRLYALRTDGFVDRELAAYGEGFRRIDELLAEIEKGAFVQTAEGGPLAWHEKLVGFPPRTGLPDETRRELILCRMGSAPFDFTAGGLRHSILACGLLAEILEHKPEEAITLKVAEIIDETLDFDRLKALASGLLPAHLDCAFDYGEMTWDILEEQTANWNAWDAADLTWTQFDLKRAGFTVS